MQQLIFVYVAFQILLEGYDVARISAVVQQVVAQLHLQQPVPASSGRQVQVKGGAIARGGADINSAAVGGHDPVNR